MFTNRRSDDVRSVVHAIRRATTLDELMIILSTKFRRLLPHRMAAFGLLQTDILRVKNVINIDFPRGYIDQVIDERLILISPVAKSWSRSQSPQFFNSDDIRGQASRRYIDAFERFDVQNIASHGVKDLASNVASYFAFGRLHAPDRDRVLKLLALVVPHLHLTFSEMLPRNAIRVRDLPANVTDLPNTAGGAPRRPRFPSLTAREREILKWLYYGKSNSEIAAILNVSTFTVKNHVQNILLKLSANNRSHAVWRAIEIGLVDMPE